jgi:YesN/AraC family two-component response regulator
LEAAGHHVREASDGRKGLEVFRNDPADVAITDIAMPERDGLEVIMHLTEGPHLCRVGTVRGL